ncbi:MAG: sulfatase-like hydrolase/transferase [Promethearchaeota archaeon]
MNHPNIIFIVLDTFRADKISENYENNILTPNLNKLLNNSIYFKNCIANAPWTLPSHISMFTGLYPSQVKRNSNNFLKISTKFPVLTEILNNLGYSSLCFSENPYLTWKEFGLNRGFEKIVVGIKDIVNWSDKKLPMISNLLNKIEHILGSRIKFKLLYRFFKRIIDEILINGILAGIIKKIFWKNYLSNYNNRTFRDLDKFFKLLKNDRINKPYYMYLNVMATHYPYLPINEVLQKFNITSKDFKKVRDFFFTNVHKFRTRFNIKLKKISKEKINIIEKFYNASVYYADMIIKKIIDELHNIGIFENSYLIITSDHGEHLFSDLDKNLWEHHTCLSVYKPVIHVPLIIYHSSFNKKLIKDQVELKDLFHTILHLTGIPIENNKYLNLNKSIINQINTKTTPKYIFGEYSKFNSDMNEMFYFFNRLGIYKSIIPKRKKKVLKIHDILLKMRGDITYLRSNELKYINYDEKFEELYNILTDPYEQENILNKYPEVHREMRSHLKDLIDKISKPEELTALITEKEKDNIKNIISNFKIKGI